LVRQGVHAGWGFVLRTVVRLETQWITHTEEEKDAQDVDIAVLVLCKDDQLERDRNLADQRSTQMFSLLHDESLESACRTERSNKKTIPLGWFFCPRLCDIFLRMLGFFTKTIIKKNCESGVSA
jgi:hypothetical protein